ncbi:RagB/SusD family nutrient uptake outer membrane protein [Cytophaga sp. FL35]|uniref:RagB/SusD family nutrient uptake outer membrane protein n=1 Tax=Cytophaga sp. FL35 TaxID=1904456 RepID=UPI00165354BB|nr:RagB/SusD family nutrient uptake outer membrane protein [Cytophaga sp. FL35]MBC7000403.1 RagB/SusD family nutrient uptake outer membrane protein [Cytophaga sp. FL35]
MKYINRKIIGGLLLAGVLGASCDTYLEEENNSSLSIETVESDPQIFNQLVASVYERARETSTYYTSDLYYALEDLGTDIVTRATAINGTSDVNDYVNFNSLNWAVGVFWTNQYKVISAANVVADLENGEVAIPDLSAAELAKGVAEAKFFRAWSYFKLVVNYGGVPLVLNQVTTSDTDYSRASEEEVYAQIITDLQTSLAGVDENPADYGRVSKDAVRHLLSKVLLTRGYKSFGSDADFTEAIGLAETVMTNHPLEGSFADLVAIGNQRNQEVVFSYLFGGNSVSRGWGNSRHMMYQFRFYDYPGLIRTVQGLRNMPTPFFYGLFSDEDQRAEATFTREIYAHEDYEAEVNGSTVTVAAGELAILLPKETWTQEEIDAVPYAVINPGTYFTNNGTTPVHFPIFTKFEDPGVPFTQPDQSSQGERDMVMMRGGEAYLIAAEAYLELGNAGQAATLLNSLRSRAGITEEVTAGDVDIDFILDERARELIGEVNRWADLKRTGKLLERVREHNPHVALNNALQEYHLLRPIPQAEIDNTGGSITQNPNYK